jgi:hypothetical protein
MRSELSKSKNMIWCKGCIAGSLDRAQHVGQATVFLNLKFFIVFYFCEVDSHIESGQMQDGYVLDISS